MDDKKLMAAELVEKGGLCHVILYFGDQKSIQRFLLERANIGCLVDLPVGLTHSELRSYIISYQGMLSGGFFGPKGVPIPSYRAPK